MSMQHDDWFARRKTAPKRPSKLHVIHQEQGLLPGPLSMGETMQQQFFCQCVYQIRRITVPQISPEASVAAHGGEVSA